MNYQHILDKNKPVRTNLRFKAEIDPHDGSLHTPTLVTPSDWDNVRHITGSIYYAWDDQPLLGCLYIATWDEE